MPTILLWLFVINLGIAFGAGLYEHRIVVSRWIRASSATGIQWDAAAALQDDTGRRFWGFVTTGPLTLLTLANVIVAWRSTGAVRSWWLAAAGTRARGPPVHVLLFHSHDDQVDESDRHRKDGGKRSAVGEA